MMNNPYIGHPSQIAGVEEVMLLKGKGKGMTLLTVRNGKGLDFTLSADRAMDISRLNFGGTNIGYFSPCGYVAPSFYDRAGSGFLKSFTAGFLTTCGLTAVGSPCTDDGEELPLHGSISNTPCETYSYDETENEIIIKAKIRDASLFGHKLILHRTYTCSKSENKITVEDTAENIGTKMCPYMILYHINIGYPLLSEQTEVFIPSNSCRARNAHAKAHFSSCLTMEKPTAGYEECCYYYDVKDGAVGVYNPDIQKGAVIRFSKDTLDCFTQWKMMGENEYVLGLEPGNCTPDGRNVCRKNGILKFLEPKQQYKTKVELLFTEKTEDFKKCL